MKTMNHAEYMKRVKTMTYNELLYTARDAKEAAAANPEGENASYYLDEVCYCSQEMHRRDQELRDARDKWQRR